MYSCRLCDAASLENVFDFGKQPIVHNLLQDKQDPQSTFHFRVALCRNCGLMQIPEFLHPHDLYQNYVTVSSWKPQPHANFFLENIIKIFGLSSSHRIFEIGTNDGGFLELLKSRGFNQFFGVEPTKDASNASIEKGLPVLRKFYDLENISAIVEHFPDPDLIVSRQVIEHIPDLNGFLEAISIHLAPGGGLALELPDHSMNFENLDYSFWEEHVNYFTIHTIRQLLEKHSFEVVHYESSLFSGKCLFVYARRAQGPRRVSFLNFDETLSTRYIKAFSLFRVELRRFLEQASNGRPIVMYGCGSRSSNLINLTEISDLYSYFVDDQPEKQGKFAPGSLLPIRNSTELDPDFFISLGVNTENEFKLVRTKNLKNYCSVLPPSALLPAFWKYMSRY
jgi:SAM-dependent methyltransferase